VNVGEGVKVGMSVGLGLRLRLCGCEACAWQSALFGGYPSHERTPALSTQARCCCSSLTRTQDGVSYDILTVRAVDMRMLQDALRWGCGSGVGSCSWSRHAPPKQSITAHHARR